FHGEAALGFRAGHCAARSVAAAHEAFRISFAPNDVRARSHAPRNNAHVALASADSALTCDQNVLVVVAFAGYIVVMAVDGLQLANERAHFAASTHRANNLLHHQIAVAARSEERRVGKEGRSRSGEEQ